MKSQPKVCVMPTGGRFMSDESFKALVRHLFFAGDSGLVAQLGETETRLLYGSYHLLAQVDERAALLQTVNPNTVIATRGHEHSSDQTYTPYGFSPVGNCSAILAFNGCWRDALSGLYPLGKGLRWYNCAIQRFLSADNLSPFGTGSFNAYTYCEGDPINFHDLSGRTRVGTSGGLTKTLQYLRVPNKFKEIIKKTIEFDPDLQHGFTGSKRRHTTGKSERVSTFNSREYELIFPNNNGAYPTAYEHRFMAKNGTEYALEKLTSHNARYEYVSGDLSVMKNHRVPESVYTGAGFIMGRQVGAASTATVHQLTSNVTEVRQDDKLPPYKVAVNMPKPPA